MMDRHEVHETLRALQWSPEFFAWSIVYAKQGHEAALALLADRVACSYVSTPQEAIECAIRAIENG